MSLERERDWVGMTDDRRGDDEEDGFINGTLCPYYARSCEVSFQSVLMHTRLTDMAFTPAQNHDSVSQPRLACGS